MAKIKAKQIDLTGINNAGNGIRKRIPVGLTLTVSDGYQYVVHAPEFPVSGDIELLGDAELIVIDTW